MFTLLLTAILLALGTSKDVEVRGPPNWNTCPSWSCSEAGGTCYNPDSAPTCDDLLDMKCKGNGKRDCKCCINCETTAVCMDANGECRPMGSCESDEMPDSTFSCGADSCTCCVETPVVCNITSSCITITPLTECSGGTVTPSTFCGCTLHEECCIIKS
ncbi:hypothetical protein Pcinc_010258 [Petrolisthes cinctipes]|uniref:Uncharacterized protein n=2 Tax=Petrolisthes cinctipes TaxID=88211 RepID=A0AAE1KVK8_PETCI|nr:hypothetical protein Pcinc_010258 [Petrolisthes cinctipes]